MASRGKIIILDEPRRRRWAAVEPGTTDEVKCKRCPLAELTGLRSRRSTPGPGRPRDPGVSCQPAGGGWMWGHVTRGSAESFKAGHLLATKTLRRWSVYSVTINSRMKQSSLIRFRGYEMWVSFAFILCGIKHFLIKTMMNQTNNPHRSRNFIIVIMMIN